MPSLHLTIWGHWSSTRSGSVDPSPTGVATLRPFAPCIQCSAVAGSVVSFLTVYAAISGSSGATFQVGCVGGGGCAKGAERCHLRRCSGITCKAGGVRPTLLPGRVAVHVIGLEAPVLCGPPSTTTSSCIVSESVTPTPQRWKCHLHVLTHRYN